MKKANRARLFIAFALPVFALFGVEFLFRQYGPPPRQGAPSDEYIQFLKENAGPFFRVETTDKGAELVQVPIIWKTARSQRFSLRKPVSVRRILVVGESSADLLGRELRDALADSSVASRFEVMNCGIGAGSIEMVRRRFDEAIQYSPDAVIFAFGHNAFYDHPPPLPRLTLWARRSRFFSYLVERFHPRSADEAFSPARRWAEVQDILRHVGRQARLRGIPVLVVILPSNLWFAPASEPEGGGPEYLNALYQYHSGRRRQAVASLRRALARRPIASWHFMLGDWLFQRGDYAGALEHLTLARDLDPARSRVSGAGNMLLRKIAAEEGLWLLDGEKWVMSRAPHGIPGWESFSDNQHVRPDVFRGLALECLDVFKNHGWRDVEVDRRRMKHSRNPLTLEDELHWALSMTPLMDGSARTSLTYMSGSWLREFSLTGDADLREAEPDPFRRSIVRLYLAEALWRAGQREKALKVNAEIQASRPRWAEPAVQRGNFYLESGRRDSALSSYREALRKDPEQAQANFFIESMAIGAPGDAVR